MEMENILLIVILIVGTILLNKEIILSDWSSNFLDKKDTEQ